MMFFFVALQPFTFNEWVWAVTDLRGRVGIFSFEHKRLVRCLALAFAAGMAMRAIPCTTEPCYYCNDWEHFCDPTGGPACSRMGTYHSYWKLPLRPNNYIWPGLWGHFAISFVPTLANGGSYERRQMILVFVTGAAAGFVAAYLSNPSTAFHEGPALWSLLAIPQHLVMLIAANYWKVASLHGGSLEKSAAEAGVQLAPLGSKRAVSLPDASGSGGGSDVSDLDSIEPDDFSDDSEPSDPESETLVTMGSTTQLRRRKRL